MPEKENGFLRFIRKDLVRNIVNTVLTALAIAAFLAGLLFAKDGDWNGFLALLTNGYASMNMIILGVLFVLFTAVSITLAVMQFKVPSTTPLLSALQVPITVIAFILTSETFVFRKTSMLFYAVSLVLSLAVFVLGITYLVYRETKPDVKREGRLRSLVLLILSLLVQASVFFVPLLGFTRSGIPTYEILYYVFLQEKSTLLSSILFLVYFIAFIVSVLFAIGHLKHLYQENDRFNSKLCRNIYLSTGVTLSFFLVGTVIAFYYKTNGIHLDSGSVSYIPFLLSSGILLADAIYNGRFKEPKKEIKHKGSLMRVVMLIFVILFTAMTVISLFSNIIIAKFNNADMEMLRINGLDILLHYKSYGESYQLVAFLLMGMVCISGLLLLISVVAFFRDSKMFKTMFMISVVANFFFIAALAAFGKSYEIVQKANIERLSEIFSYYGISGVEMECKVKSDVFYFFLAATGLLVALFLLRPYTRYVIAENEASEVTITGDSVIGVEARQGENGEAGAVPMPAPVPAPAETPAQQTAPEQAPPAPIAPEPALAATAEETAPAEPAHTPAQPSVSKPSLPAIDQCPPFTFLDEQVPVYQAKLEERNATKFEEGVTLKSLVEFVVDYAKNSRLHLSYTPEDIATFVAGLGIGRLSILQGMSGTGKTSLPKIFSEAVFGNCEIVEVESSWKDKNELLGYYNEFSRIYTPKKFTQDLYKAKHNPEVITFIVLDEMNLSRIEYYFSDFLSLMENEEDKREIKLVNIRIANYESGERVPYLQLTDDMVLKIPNNVWFIGTANRDESTFEISDKVYDRASTMNFNKRAKKITKFDDPMSPRFLDTTTFRALLNNAMQTVNFDLSNMKQIAKAEELLAPYNLSFGNRIERQIENFVKIYSACFKGKNVIKDALEKIFLSKVIAKLEFKTVENKDELADGFDEIGFAKCAEFIRKLNEDV